MAALYGSNATKRNSVPAELIPQGEVGGEMKMAYDEITPSAALGLNDTIEFMKLPKGARIVGGWLKFAAQGGSCAIKIGNLAGDSVSADDDSLATEVISSAGIVLLSAENAALFGTQLSEELTISGLVTVAGANTGAKIQLCVQYVLA